MSADTLVWSAAIAGAVIGGILGYRLKRRWPDKVWLDVALLVVVMGWGSVVWLARA